MHRLPFALSIPHGGVETPEELASLVVATAADQREDIDHLTREIFGVPEGMVATQLTFGTARTFVDLNRHPDDCGPQHPDGVVKSMTHLNRQVFSSYPDEGVVKGLLDRLYRPYHAALARAVADPEVVLLLDCHSMAPHGLPTSPDRPGQPRPLVNLGHMGGASAPLELVECLRQTMAEVYEIPLEEVVIDHPFTGGYISAAHHTATCHAIQIEFNRRFYLGDQEGLDSPVLPPDVLAWWRLRFSRTLQLLYQRAFVESRESVSSAV